jgi:sensor histidine kinase regulating citrate/malate metabolism
VGLRERFPDAGIDIDIAVAEPTIDTRPPVLKLALTNLAENALKHASEPEPTVQVQVRTVESDRGMMAIEIRDSNARISETEIDVLRTGAESPLQHGQGIGLWVVNWCVTSLNGDIAYRYDEGNRFVITLPSD